MRELKKLDLDYHLLSSSQHFDPYNSFSAQSSTTSTLSGKLSSSNNSNNSNNNGGRHHRLLSGGNKQQTANGGGSLNGLKNSQTGNRVGSSSTTPRGFNGSSINNSNSNNSANAKEEEKLTWIHELFQGILVNETKCLNCETVI